MQTKKRRAVNPDCGRGEKENWTRAQINEVFIDNEKKENRDLSTRGEGGGEMKRDKSKRGGDRSGDEAALEKKKWCPE